MAEACVLQINDLRLHGFTSTHGVTNFLNIQYARILARFQTAQLLPLAERGGDVNASQYGPRCPQGKDDIHALMSHLYENLSSDGCQSEMDCLHLNVYSPPGAVFLRNREKFPVLVYIHGGGFNFGNNTTDFDGNHLVRRSIEAGKPIIIITVNYRLNAFGCLSSRELSAEASTAGQAPVLNQGLHDAKLALQWIQTHVHHFHGDKDRVTVSGESAGATSIWCLMKSKTALFQQAILQSAVYPSLRTFDEAQAAFDQLVSAAGISTTASPETKLEALRNLSANELVSIFNCLALPMPVEDPEWFELDKIHTASYWANIPTWCDRIMIGSNTDEAALFLAHPLATATPEELSGIMHNLFPSENIRAKVQSLSLIRSAPTDLDATIALSSYVLFHGPKIDLADHAVSLDKRIWVYEMKLKDPFPGVLHGYSWHSMAVPLLFYQPPCQTEASLAITADSMSLKHFDFIYGSSPWEEYGLKQRVWIWNGNESSMELDARTDELQTMVSSFDPDSKRQFEEAKDRLLLAVLDPHTLLRPRARNSCPTPVKDIGCLKCHNMHD